MRLEYELVPQDFADYIAYHHGPGGGLGGRAGPGVRLARFGFPALWVLLTLPAVLRRHRVGATELVLWGVALAWAAALPAWLRRGAARRVRRVAQQGLSRGAVGPRQLNVDDRGVAEATPFYRHAVYWPGVARVADGPAHVFIYTGPNAAFIVPKRALGGEAGAAALLQEVERRLRHAAA